MSGACMTPTSVLPSGVSASPSMPLLSVRPLVLLLVSTAPCGDWIATERLAGQSERLDQLPGRAIELAAHKGRIRRR